MTLGARQRRETARETEAELRRRAQRRLKELRQLLKGSKAHRRVRLGEVGKTCKAARRAISARAKAARARLNRSIARTREQAKTVCSSARGEAYSSTLQSIERAAAALQGELAEQNRLRVWAKPRSSKTPMPGGVRKARERLEESDGEVAANIDDPGLRVVWEHVKGRIKAGKHRSRTEAFFEWAAEHTADVYAIQERDAETRIAELEREERALSKALRKTGPSGRRALEAVPF